MLILFGVIMQVSDRLLLNSFYNKKDKDLLKKTLNFNRDFLSQKERMDLYLSKSHTLKIINSWE